MAGFIFSYRYLFVMEQEYQRLARSALIRGFQPGTNTHTYRTYAYFVGMLFIRAFERAERVNRAMKCRGYDGRFHSLYYPPSPKRLWSLVPVMCCMIAPIVILEWITIP